jgi:hypothetical protein
MPACSSHWEAHRDGYAEEKPDIGRGVAADSAKIGDREAGRSVVRARFNPAIPVSNRHHDELAR